MRDRLLTLNQMEALKPYEHIWRNYQRESCIPNLDHPKKVSLETVYKEVFQRGGINLYCPHCILDMIRDLFNLYDRTIEHIKKQAVVETQEDNDFEQEEIIQDEFYDESEEIEDESGEIHEEISNPEPEITHPNPVQNNNQQSRKKKKRNRR